jgi:hypothetical protein
MPVKAIPDVPKGQDPARTRFDQSVKEALRPFARMDALGELPSTATLAEVIAKVNSMLAAVQR